MIITRTEYSDRCESVGEVDGYEFKVLELPNLDNKPFVSCIPYGQYVVERDHTGKHQFYAVRNVDGRSYIELHPAYSVKQLEGCLAFCEDIIDGKTVGSHAANHKLISIYGDKSWVLEIVKG